MPVVPAALRWTELANINFENLPSTSWTSADQGTTPVVGGVSIYLQSLAGANTAAVGGGTGLRYTAGGVGNMYVRLTDTTDMRPYRSLAFTFAMSGGTVNLGAGTWLGMAWDNCWATLNGQVQRRTQLLGTDFWGTAAPARTAVCYHVTANGITASYRNTAVDLDNLPGPWESGWTWWHGATIVGGPWPFTGTSDRPWMNHWGNGDTTFVHRSVRLWGC